jgi:hypothetical protein
MKVEFIVDRTIPVSIINIGKVDYYDLMKIVRGLMNELDYVRISGLLMICNEYFEIHIPTEIIVRDGSFKFDIKPPYYIYSDIPVDPLEINENEIVVRYFVNDERKEEKIRL